MTILAAGDIAIIGFSADGTDGLRFVTLVDLEPNTIIFFRDDEYNDASSDFNGNEAVLTYDSGGTTLAAGTVVTITDIFDSSGPTPPMTDPGRALTVTGGGSAVANTTFATPSTSVNFGTSNEAVYAYQTPTNEPDTGPFTLITLATHDDGGDGGDLGGLVYGETAIDLTTADLDADAYVYDKGATNFTTAEQARAAIFDPSNWSTADTGGDDSALFTNASTASFGIGGTPTPGDDDLLGSPGDDNIDLQAGNDSYDGLGGADTIQGGLGDDSLTGGSGADQFVYSPYDTANAQADIVVSGDFNVAEDTVGFGDNGPASYAMLLAGLLRPDGAGAQIRGFYDGRLQTLTLEDIDTADLTESNFVFDTSGTPRTHDASATTGQTVLFGGLGNDTLIGGSGGDAFLGDAGADSMVGNDGNDRFFVDDAGDVVVETINGGTDTIYAQIDLTLAVTQYIEFLRAARDFGPRSLTGNQIANNIYGDVGDDTLDGGDGDDLLHGGIGADDMTGGTGNDTFYVDNSGDSIHEATSGGTDVLYATANFTLQAGQEVETLRVVAGHGGIALGGNDLANYVVGASGDDTLSGGGGNDRLYGDAGNDSMAGGTGSDIYYVHDAGDTVTEASGEGTDTVVVYSNWALQAGQEVEYLRIGNNSGLSITGNELGNAMYGAGGADSLQGSDGGDLLYGGTGADSMNGGGGNDTYYVDNVGDTVFDTEGGTDTVYTSVNFTLAAGQGIEHLRAGSSGLSLTGNELANHLTGSSGNDSLQGGDGGDYLYGGAGADSMNGGAGDDRFFVDNIGDTVFDIGGGTDTVYTSVDFTIAAGQGIEYVRASSGASLSLGGNELANFLVGAGGNDTLDGGTGNDILMGGGGADVFMVGSGWGIDRITDFQDGVDTIDMSQVTGVTFGDLSFQQTGTTAAVSDGTNTLLLFNTNIADLTVDDFQF